LSLMIVRMRTPMISIGGDGSRARGHGPERRIGTPKGIRTPDLHLERVAS
jgi:hypothetical protein